MRTVPPDSTDADLVERDVVKEELLTLPSWDTVATSCVDSKCTPADPSIEITPSEPACRSTLLVKLSTPTRDAA
jgi:hypothetical protein